MSEGYGYSWTGWDKLVRERFKKQLEKLGPCKYRNFEAFRSPKGRWMAFHNTSYSDIKVIDLETLETVFTNFYSNRVLNEKGEYDKEKSTYADHTNVSTFVPTYLRYSNKEKSKYDHLIDPCGLEENDIKQWNEQFDNIVSLPFAFNAWTIWAADFELYVDVLDLRRIDEGIVNKWEKKTSFIIPHEADHVRNYVKFDANLSDDNKETHVDFTILTERMQDRLVLGFDNDKKFNYYDMYNSDVQYKIEEELPWEGIAKRIAKYKVAKENKDV